MSVTRSMGMKRFIMKVKIRRALVLVSVLLVVFTSLSLQFGLIDFLGRGVARLSASMTLKEVILEEVGSSNLSDLVTKESLFEVSGLAYGQEVLRIDLKGVEQRLKTIPWLESVHIQKRLPGVVSVKYQVYNARVLCIKNRKPWIVSDGGLLLAPVDTLLKPIASQQKKGFQELVSAIEKPAAAATMQMNSNLDQKIDLPVLHQEATIADELRWLDALEKELSPFILQVHEITLDKTGAIRALIELNYKNYSSKLVVTSFTQIPQGAMNRLRKVVGYLIENHIMAESVDLRPGKKVVVNIGKRS